MVLFSWKRPVFTQPARGHFNFARSLEALGDFTRYCVSQILHHTHMGGMHLQR